MFNDKFGLTKAVLEGRKTQTRRIALLPQKEVQNLEDYLEVTHEDKSILRYIIDRYCHLKVGETLAVAQDYETVNREYIDKVFRCHGKTGRDILDNGMEACKTCKNPDYCLDKYASVCTSPGWQNKMFVKADLMIHQIRITDIRLERLQDISDEDCLKEGIIEDSPGVQYSFPTEIGYCSQYPFDTPKAAYAALIDKISGKGTWGKNPWVFVYNFEFVK